MIDLGEPRPKELWKSSYRQWVCMDRHAQAYEVLKNDRSLQIMTNLARLERTEAVKPATSDVRCLACHSNPTLAARVDAAAVTLHADGVSCEACHGDAKKWRLEHTTWSKSGPRDARYDNLGMTRLYDPAVRAETCAGCHVGAPADPRKGIPLRDVNHDLIAAGHPRLRFEFTTYSRLMPPHWNERDRETEEPRPAGFEAEWWIIGQTTQAAATLRLLSERAKDAREAQERNARSDDGSQQPIRWPEFAEFNCYACHHDLNPAGWRAQTQVQRQRPGSLLWNQPGFPNASDPRFQAAEDATKQADPRGRKIDDVEKAAAAAAGAWSGAQQTFLNQDDKRPPSQQIIALLRPSETDWDRLEWDEAARIYHAMAAIENARRDQSRRDPNVKIDPEAARNLAELFDLLRMRREPERLDSPRDYAPNRVRKLLKDWFERNR